MTLKIENLTKIYKKRNSTVRALNHLNLEFGEGIYGLLGPNGAGKTTLMNILATVAKPTKGNVYWNEHNVLKTPNLLRNVLGYLPQYFGVYPNLTAEEFLTYMAAVKGITGRSVKPIIDELLQLVNLTEVSRRPLGSYSGGMKQRVGIAQALLNNPQLLIVDEPTVGLDPEERVRFRQLITELSLDRVIILSTHIVSDVESVATKIIIINKGNLLRFSSPEELLREMEGKTWLTIIPSSELSQYQKKHIISGTIRRKDGLHLRIISDNQPFSAQNSELITPTLEDAYMYVISHQPQSTPNTKTPESYTP
jgi:ABC-2 type transport system ATP-binding protein